MTFIHQRANWVIIALMVSWLVANWEKGRERCFEAASSRCCLGAMSDDAFLIADGGEHLGLDLLVECGADVLGDIGGGADIVLCQAEVAQSGLGLSRSDQVARPEVAARRRW